MRDGFRFRWAKLFKPLLNGTQTLSNNEATLEFLINDNEPLPTPSTEIDYSIQRNFDTLVTPATNRKVNRDPWVSGFATYFVNVIAKDKS